MKFLLFALFLGGTFAFSKTFELKAKIVLDFLKFNNLNSGICFYCGQLSRDWFKTIENDFVYLSYQKLKPEKLRKFEEYKIFVFNQPKVGVIFDTTCNKTGDLFEKFSALKFFNASYSWLMFADNFEISTKMLRSQNINLDAEITLAVNKNETSLDLFEVYNPNPRTNGKLVVDPIGQWTPKSGYNVTLKETKYQRRSNLNGVVFRAAIIAHPTNESLVQYMEREDKVFDVIHRYQYGLFKILQEKHNFRYHFQFAKFLT